MASWLDDLDGVLSRSRLLERPFDNGKSGQVATLNQGQREEARDESIRGKAARSRAQVSASSQRERGRKAHVNRIGKGSIPESQLVDSRRERVTIEAAEAK